MVLNINHIFVMVVMVYYKKLLVYVKGSAYRIHFWYISKDDTISIIDNPRIDIIICLKKRSKNWKNTKKENIKKQKSLNIIINKIIF